MKVEEKLKAILVILVIILISIISFGGIYIQKTKFVENIIPEYKLGMDLSGGRAVELAVDDSTNTVIYDKNGNVVTEEGKNTTKVEEPVNKADTLTLENYKEAKKVIETRLKEMNISNYIIRQDETNGKLYVQLPENNSTDLIIQYMAIKGDFTVVNDNRDILLDNSHIKKAQVGYSTTASGTAVYLTIKLNKEGTQIFKDITNTYTSTIDEDGNEVTNEITLKIDSSTLLNTHFENEISDGTIQMSIGSASSDSDTIQKYIQEASNIAVLLNSGRIPLTYTISQNRYVMSDITEQNFYIPAIIIGVIILISIIVLIVKYKKSGIISSIAFIGYIATLLIVLRYTNVVLTIEGITAIAIVIALEYIFTLYLLNLIKNSNSKSIIEVAKTFKQALIKTLLIFIPVAITSIVLCFSGWLSIYSFGMVMFWGLALIVLYNLIITRTLIINIREKR